MAIGFKSLLFLDKHRVCKNNVQQYIYHINNMLFVAYVKPSEPSWGIASSMVCIPLNIPKNVSFPKPS